MTPGSRTVAAATALLALLAAAAAAQEPHPPSGAVRGEVTSAATGEQLAYAVVALHPTFGARFTDDGGRFRFTALAPGTYRLIVRQVGYLPLDTAIMVRDSAVAVRVALKSIAVQLPAVLVVADPRCDSPGAPDRTANPDLALVFDQLRENADRYRLLADAYPFRYWMVRVISEEERGGSVRVRSVDTLEFRSDARWRYAPGRLVGVTEGPRRRRERVLNIPQLPDLADSTFHRAHCFWLSGPDTLEGASHLRVDFFAAQRLRDPDVDGTAFLNPETHQLRHLRLRLTQPRRAAVGLDTLAVTATFGEIVPAIIVPARIRAVTSLAANRSRRAVVRQTEEQRLLRVEFLQPLPTGARAPAP